MSSGWHQALAVSARRKSEKRLPKVVCGSCEHFKERERNVGHVTVPRPKWQDAGRPPADYNKECLWFHSAEGRAATADQRLSVMVAGANGGAGCPTRETDR